MLQVSWMVKELIRNCQDHIPYNFQSVLDFQSSFRDEAKTSWLHNFTELIYDIIGPPLALKGSSILRVMTCYHP